MADGKRTLRNRLMTRIVDRLCAQGHLRPEWFTIHPREPGTGHPQMMLQITDKCDGTPMGRVYLHPDRMREFCRLGIETADRYMAEWESTNG